MDRITDIRFTAGFSTASAV